MVTSRNKIRRLNGYRLRQERNRLNLTQYQLAEALGISRASISIYESGTNSPTWDIVMPLVSLGFNMAWVLGLDQTNDSLHSMQSQPAMIHSFDMSKHGLVKRMVINHPLVEEKQRTAIDQAIDYYLILLKELTRSNGL